MKNNRGQALLEFVTILPIFLMLVFAVIDFGRVIYEKNVLESTLNEAIDMYQDSKTDAEIGFFVNTNRVNLIKFNKVKNNQYVTLTLETTIPNLTPGLNLVSDEIFKIKVERVIYDE